MYAHLLTIYKIKLITGLLKKRSPFTAGTRWKKLPRSNLGNSKVILRGLSSKLISNSGVNTYGRKVARFRCSRPKIRYYAMPLITNYLKVPSVVCSLFKVSYRTSLVACLQYTTGSYCYSPAFHGMRVGSIVTWLNRWSFIKHNTYYNFNLGSIIQLGKLPRFSVISNVSLLNDYKPRYAKSAGTYCFIDEILDEVGVYIIKLPSGARRILSKETLVRVGRNSNISQKYSVIGKAGYNINRGHKQIVRGVAMNPVDHPNGGRTKTNKPEKSIWGWIAKRGS